MKLCIYLIKTKIWNTLFVLFLFINKKKNVTLEMFLVILFFFFLIVNPYFLLIHIHLKIVTYAYVFKSAVLI